MAEIALLRMPVVDIMMVQLKLARRFLQHDFDLRSMLDDGFGGALLIMYLKFPGPAVV